MAAVGWRGRWWSVRIAGWCGALRRDNSETGVFGCACERDIDFLLGEVLGLQEGYSLVQRRARDRRILQDCDGMSAIHVTRAQRRQHTRHGRRDDVLADHVGRFLRDALMHAQSTEENERNATLRLRDDGPKGCLGSSAGANGSCRSRPAGLPMPAVTDTCSGFSCQLQHHTRCESTQSDAPLQPWTCSQNSDAVFNNINAPADYRNHASPPCAMCSITVWSRQPDKE